jgi:hypothetical protein
VSVLAKNAPLATESKEKESNDAIVAAVAKAIVGKHPAQK